MRATGRVVSISRGATHRFSKPVCAAITLLTDRGVEGDAHASAFVQHRHSARKNPKLPNARQVHLMEAELFDRLESEGFTVRPGELGENITTRGLALRHLSLGAQLRIGSSAIVVLTGLRTPCVLIDRFQKGLLKAVIQKKETPRFLVGVFAAVGHGGVVRAGDPVTAVPPEGLQPLPEL
jgi:MOSC domain-containing protein YiiM